MNLRRIGPLAALVFCALLATGASSCQDSEARSQVAALQVQVDTLTARLQRQNAWDSALVRVLNDWKARLDHLLPHPPGGGPDQLPPPPGPPKW